MESGSKMGACGQIADGARMYGGHMLRARLRRPALVVGAVLALATTSGVPRKAATINNDANRLFEAKKFDEAASLYEEAQTHAPESPEIPYNLGNTLYRQGKLADAAAHLKRGVGDTDPMRRQNSFYNLGNALYKLGKLPEAVYAYRRALTLDPHDQDAKINFEKAFDELKKQQKQQQQQGGGNSPQQQDQNQQGQSGEGEQQQGGQQQGGDQGSQNQPEQGQPPEPKPNPDQENQSGEQRGETNPQDQQPQDRLAGIDSVAAGDLSREEALRILEAMREQEKELQKERARRQVRSRKVEKDW
jgi:Ca-activated chloride channel family protein